jgi:hypothetical protein
MRAPAGGPKESQAGTRRHGVAGTGNGRRRPSTATAAAAAEPGGKPPLRDYRRGRARARQGVPRARGARSVGCGPGTCAGVARAAGREPPAAGGGTVGAAWCRAVRWDGVRRGLHSAGWRRPASGPWGAGVRAPGPARPAPPAARPASGRFVVPPRRHAPRGRGGRGVRGGGASSRWGLLTPSSGRRARAAHTRQGGRRPPHVHARTLDGVGRGAWGGGRAAPRRGAAGLPARAPPPAARGKTDTGAARPLGTAADGRVRRAARRRGLRFLFQLFWGARGGRLGGGPAPPCGGARGQGVLFRGGRQAPAAPPAERLHCVSAGPCLGQQTTMEGRAAAPGLWACVGAAPAAQNKPNRF